MLGHFRRYQETANIVGKEPEKVVMTRQTKSGASNFKQNFVYTCLCQDNTALENGDVFTVKMNCAGKPKEETFIVVSVRHSDYSIQATAYKCNGVAEIFRPEEKYNDYDELIGYDLNKITEMPVNHMTVNAHMRLLDEGLLPSTTKEFRIPKCDIKEMDLIILKDQFNGEDFNSRFCVDVIDRTKFDGLLAVQTSNDNRNFDEL